MNVHVADDLGHLLGLRHIRDVRALFGDQLLRTAVQEVGNDRQPPLVAQFPGGRQLGRAPEPGDDVSYDGMRFDVLEVEGNRIERIAVTFERRPEPRDEAADYVDEDEVE